MRKNNSQGIWHIVLLSIVCIFTFFVNNQTIYPDIMESRNIVTAREMVYDGHWLVPTMNGDLRLEKPPLPTWITAAAERLSPDDLGLQRAMAGVAATMLVFFFYLLGRDFTGNEDFAWISSLVLCTSYNIVLMGRTASWDIYCHAFMMGAIYFIYYTYKQKDGGWMSSVLAGIFLGLSFLSKGPVSFYGLLLPFIIAFIFYGAPFQRRKWSHLFVMIFVCLLVSTWWYLYIYFFRSEVADYVFHKESSAWIGHNVRPWYYYSTFFLEMGVWALMLLTAIVFPVWMKRLKMKKEYSLILLWLVLQLVLLSLFPEKKKRYLLPALIPASYLIGFILVYWKEYSNRRSDKVGQRLYVLNTYLISFVCLLIPVLGYWFVYRSGFLTLDRYLLISIILIVISGWLFLTSWRREPFYFVYGIVALFIISEVVVMPYIGDLVNNPDFKSISETRSIRSLNNIPFYNIKGQDVRIEIIYEAHRKIRPLNVKDSVAILKALPFALLTHVPVQKVFPSAFLKKVKVRWIGQYDNNRRPKGTRRYSNDFIYNVTVLEKR